MDKKLLKVLKALGGPVLGLLLIVGMLGSVAAAPQPAPLAARVVTINTGAIAADTNFRAIDWSSYTEADLFYRVTEGTVNTLTLELEVSPDGTNWYDHNISGTLVTVATTTNGYAGSISVEGAQFRIVANATNTQTITPNLKIVLR